MKLYLAVAIGFIVVICWNGEAIAQNGKPDRAEAPMEPSPGAALRNCDGLPGASRSGDGILRPHRSVDALGRMRPSFQHAIAYCDRALSILDSFPQYWLRRVSILHGRAIHRLIGGDPDGALTDLDLADATVLEPGDVDYVRTLGVNSQLIRAMALVMRGDTESGEALALEARARRPYTRSVLLSALMVVGSSSNRDRARTLLTELERLDPHWIDVAASYNGGAPLPPRDLQAFFMLMLEAESPNRRARGSGSSFIRPTCGQAQETPPPEQSAGPTGLCASSTRDTSAMVEERVLYRVARQFLDVGISHFVIERRHDTSHWTTNPYSRVADQSGYVSEIKFRALSEGTACGRCIDAAEVVQALGPRYGIEVDSESRR